MEHEYPAGEYRVAVIGAGHAGIEAALAAARLHESVILFTINLDAVGNMPCNPSIGGTGKGHLVREIDALGGEMGRAADETALQHRMLNLGKGAAVHSLRVQSDRRRYQMRMKRVLEETEGLDLRQAEIVELRKTENGFALVTRTGAVFLACAVVIATGTYLEGRVHIGEINFESGPDGMFPSKGLSASLAALGISLRRFKTGTPSRLHRDSIDFSQLEVQHGDARVVPFSFDNPSFLADRPQEDCFICYTNEETHDLIRRNLGRSPLYAGRITGVGPRYCPSIEDKVVRFSEKPRHQLFIEPMGSDTREMYLGGMSSSLPEEAQLAMMRTVKGLEHVKVMRHAYAIEYDCADPTQLTPALMFRALPGLFGAGQFNGTSGYEEAAAQGLMAGINAVRFLRKEEPFLLDRASSYIGTLIDDLVTKGTNEPYRMMTSRSEYRLLLRQDNADRRLMARGAEIGLVPQERLAKMQQKVAAAEKEIERLKTNGVPPSDEVNAFLAAHQSTPIANGITLAELLRRPELDYASLGAIDKARPSLDFETAEQVEIAIKYEGYIARELRQVKEMRRMEERKIPPDFDFNAVSGLRLEARAKLNAVRPLSIGQASRISGVSPADITVLLIALAK